MLLRNSAKLTSGDDSEEEKVWKVCLCTLSSSSYNAVIYLSTIDTFYKTSGIKKF